METRSTGTERGDRGEPGNRRGDGRRRRGGRRRQGEAAAAAGACVRQGVLAAGSSGGTDPKAPGGPLSSNPTREKRKKTETESVRGWTTTRKSVRIFGPFSGGLLKRPSLLHTNSDWSDYRAYGFVSPRGTTFSRSLCENLNLQGWLLQAPLKSPAGTSKRVEVGFCK